jgi:ligand-binding sensor domain-containing protein
MQLNMKFYTLTLLFFILLLTKQQNAQVYNFMHYNVDDGLPQANADCLLQDSLGNLWISTQVGAVRFDGSNYFLLNEEKGLASHLVRKIFLDSKQNLWFGTYHGLSFYNYDTITNFTTNQGLPDNYINFIWNDQNDVLWVMTGKGAAYLHKGKFEKIDLPDASLQLYSSKLYEGEVYLATNKGLWIQKNKTFRKSKYSELEKFQIVDIEFFNNRTWLTTHENGLVTIGENDTITYYNSNTGFITNYTTKLLRTYNDHLWIGTEGNGAIRYDGKEFVQFSEENGMKNTSVLDLIEDSEINIWFGGRNGIVMFNPHNPFVHYLNANRESEESIFGMLNDNEGNLWFTTYGNGLSKFDGSTFTYFTEEDGIWR